MGRTPCCEKGMGLKKGPWTPDEDQKLISYIERHGHGSWRTLPKRAGLLRCGKSCRLRWTNYLRPDIKRGHFSAEEERAILHLHALLGNKWSTIAGHLPGRTDNEIKNYWNTHLKKRLLQLGIDPVTHRPQPQQPQTIYSTDFANTLQHPFTCMPHHLEPFGAAQASLYCNTPNARSHAELSRFFSSVSNHNSIWHGPFMGLHPMKQINNPNEYDKVSQELTSSQNDAVWEGDAVVSTNGGFRGQVKTEAECFPAQELQGNGEDPQYQQQQQWALEPDYFQVPMNGGDGQPSENPEKEYWSTMLRAVGSISAA